MSNTPVNEGNTGQTSGGNVNRAGNEPPAILGGNNDILHAPDTPGVGQSQERDELSQDGRSEPRTPEVAEATPALEGDQGGTRAGHTEDTPGLESQGRNVVVPDSVTTEAALEQALQQLRQQAAELRAQAPQAAAGDLDDRKRQARERREELIRKRQMKPFQGMLVGGRNENGSSMSRPGQPMSEAFSTSDGVAGEGSRDKEDKSSDDNYSKNLAKKRKLSAGLGEGASQSEHQSDARPPTKVQVKPKSQPQESTSQFLSMKLEDTCIPNRTWPPSKLGAHKTPPARPTWWDEVELEDPDVYIQWRGSLQFCRRCRDGGTALPMTPSVRCQACLDIYCVDEEAREYNTGCIAVPEGAKDWLCPKCRAIWTKGTGNHNETEQRAESLRKMARSKMNLCYEERASEFRGPPAVLRSPLLIIEIRCFEGENRPPMSIAQAFFLHMCHIYGSISDMELSHQAMNVSSLTHRNSDHSTSQLECIKFLETHEDANVLITVDAHTFIHTGDVSYSISHGAPISILLWSALGPKLWSSINKTSGTRLLVPLVCGWMWKYQKQVAMAGDLLQQWTLTQDKKTQAIPPLVNYIIGFSTPALVSWAIALQLQGTLEAIFITEALVHDSVISRLASDMNVMATTGVIFGQVSSSHKVHFELMVRGSEGINIFGLPPPKHCQMLTGSGEQCGGLAKLEYQRAAKQGGKTVPARVYAVCLDCKASTPSFAAPAKVVDSKDANLFHWNLIRPEQEWLWSKEPKKNFLFLVN